MNDDWLEAYRAAHLLEAYNLKGMLEAMGVKVRLKGEGLGAGVGELPPQETEVALWVETNDYNHARQALAEYEHSQNAPWFCRSCGEHNEASFELCWHCLQEAPE